MFKDFSTFHEGIKLVYLDLKAEGSKALDAKISLATNFCYSMLHFAVGFKYFIGG